MDINQLIPLLQVTDSGFPTGGFSHSLGLEAYIQRFGVSRAAKDHRFLTHAFVCILENTGSFSLPFVKAAHHAITSDCLVENLKSEHHTLRKLDKMCEACTTNHIAKRASTKQGLSFLEVTRFTFNNLADELKTAVVDLPHCHYPVVFGAMLACLGMDENATLASLLFCVVRSAIATAVRLDVLGPMQGQKIQHNLQQLIPEIIDRNKSRSVEEASLKFPVIDILQNTHDTLYCKLFYS